MKELSDEEILQYLMTSDLNENFRPDEYKFLIFKSVRVCLTTAVHSTLL